MTKLHRKVIQVSALPAAGLMQDRPQIIALCDDGTMWHLPSGKNWIQLPDVPQGETWDEWLKSVGAYLMARQEVAQENVDGVVADNLDTLRKEFDDRTRPHDAARKIAPTSKG